VQVNAAMTQTCCLRPIGLYICGVVNKGINTRNFIIEKAAPLFNTKGIAGTSIRDIMDATKLAKGGIYRHFDSKDEICLDAFKFLCLNLSAGINEALKNQQTPADKLFAFIDYYKNDLTKIEGGCPLLNFGTEADDTNQPLKKLVGERIQALQNRLSSLIKTGIEEKQFEDSIDPEVFAAHIFSVLEGAMLMAKVFGNLDQMEIVTDKLKAEIKSFLK
jgi:TetR/AcrR family transcriptional repressor of nem operon